MTYPFEFRELLLTDRILNILGFSEYWDGCGDFGSRSLNLGSNLRNYEIREMDEQSDACNGYDPPTYISNHYCSSYNWSEIYFLHELYEDILNTRSPEEVEYFISITKRDGASMYPFIKSWIEYKEKILRMNTY